MSKSDDILIKAEGVSKKFCRSLKRSMVYGVEDIARDVLHFNLATAKLRKDEFWALDDVSFEVKRGECLGIIGRNGAGKSTLLKMLNGIILPDKGRITIKGDVGAIIEVGAGFHPMLTGRENIYINGAILGLSKRDIDQRFDEIVAFSELEEFIDMPVKHYSSGMYVRLGFAIAIQMEPDVLILDEVLAVGDLSFQAKCFNTIHKLLQKSAVLFVSHNMPQVSRICSNISVLHKGNQLFSGNDVVKGIEIYNTQCVDKLPCTISGSSRAVVHNVEFESNGKNGVNTVDYGKPWAIQCEVSIDPEIRFPCIGFGFFSSDLRLVAQCISHFNRFQFENTGERMVLRTYLDQCNLTPGAYWLTIAIQGDDYGEILIRYTNYQKITVDGWFTAGTTVSYLGLWNIDHKVNKKKK